MKTQYLKSACCDARIDQFGFCRDCKEPSGPAEVVGCETNVESDIDQVNIILAKEERVSTDFHVHRPIYDTPLTKAAKRHVALGILLAMAVAFAAIALFTTPDERITGRVSSGVVQEVIR